MGLLYPTCGWIKSTASRVTITRCNGGIYPPWWKTSWVGNLLLGGVNFTPPFLQCGLSFESPPDLLKIN